MTQTRIPLRPLVLALAACAALSACGGGGGGPAVIGSSQLASTSLSGSAIDAPIANAQITITANAPTGDTGSSTIGTIGANGQGGFTIQVTLPSGSVPIFANAVDPANSLVTLSSYLGQSDALAAAGTLNAASNLPDLDISPVTTAALAVYAQLNGSNYANLTPTTYATNLQTYGSDILAIAAAIKAVGDNLCTPSTTSISGASTTNLATIIAQGAALSSANPTTLSTAITTLGGNCASVLASLPSAISADPYFGPELDLGDVIDAGVTTVPAGTYQLQGVVAQTGFGATASTLSSTLTAQQAVAPADVFDDAAVSVSSTGAISSTDGNVSGNLVGNLLTLSLIDPATGTTYTLRGKVGSLPTALSGGAQAYALRSGGIYTATGGGTMLAKFDAVLAPTSATPVWNGITPPSSASGDGIRCSNGFPLRLDVFAAHDGGGSIGECVSASPGSWTLSAATPTGSGDNFSFEDPSRSTSNPGSGYTNGISSTPPTLSAPIWSEVSGAPFVLGASGAQLTVNGTTLSGTLYYVMGTQTAVLASGSGGTGANTLLHLHDNQLTQVSEASRNDGASQGGDAGSGAANGDH